MTKIYTLISYIPGEEGWHDRCGDYISGKESELNIDCFKDKQELADVMAQKTFNNNDIELTILFDGIDINNYDDFISKEELKNYEKDQDEIYALMLPILENLRIKKAEQDAATKLKKQQEQEAFNLLVKKKTEDAERIQLAKLLEKYGN